MLKSNSAPEQGGQCWPYLSASLSPCHRIVRGHQGCEGNTRGKPPYEYLLRLEWNQTVKSKPNVPCALWVSLCFAFFLFSLEPELTTHLSMWFLGAWRPSLWMRTGLGQWGNKWARAPIRIVSSFYLSLKLRFSRLQMAIMIVKKQALSLLMRIIKLNNSWAPATYGAPNKTQIYPALSGNEVFHISELSGKLGLTSLAAMFFLKILTVWDGNRCPRCRTLSCLAKQFVKYHVHHFLFLDVSLWTCNDAQGERGVSICNGFGSLLGQPTSSWLKISCMRARCCWCTLSENQGFLSLTRYPLQPCHSKGGPQNSKSAPGRWLEMQTLWPHPWPAEWIRFWIWTRSSDDSHAH